MIFCRKVGESMKIVIQNPGSNEEDSIISSIKNMNDKVHASLYFITALKYRHSQSDKEGDKIIRFVASSSAEIKKRQTQLLQSLSLVR